MSKINSNRAVSASSRGKMRGILILLVLLCTTVFALMSADIKVRGEDMATPELVLRGEEVASPSVILHDECNDLSEANALVVDKLNMGQEGTFFKREGSSEAHITWKASADIGSFEAKIWWTAGQANYEYVQILPGSGQVTLWVSDKPTSGFIQVPITSVYNVKSGDDLHDWVKITNTAEITEPGKKYFKIATSTGGTAWLPMIEEVTAYKAADKPIVEVESVTISTAETTFESGASLVFDATILPTNSTARTPSWEVFDNADCSTESTVAAFTASELKSNFDGLEDKTVYVRASAGGVNSDVKTVVISKKPDAATVTIAKPSKTTVMSGQSIQLAASVLPLNSNNNTIEWKAYAAATGETLSNAVKLTGGLVTAEFIKEDSVKVYIQAGVNKLLDYGATVSERLEITVEKVKTLLADDCSTTDFVYKSLTDMDGITTVDGKGMIKRNFPKGAVDPNSFGVLGQGSAKTGDDVIKCDVPSVYYKVHGDALSFGVKLDIYDAGNGALNPANKVYFASMASFYVSNGVEVDGKLNWVFVPADYTAEQDELIDASNYTVLTFTNTGALPAGTRYLRVDLIGACSISETVGGTEEEPTYTYSPYTGAQLTEEQYGSIAMFYNTFSPFLAGVSIYADKDAEVEKVTIALSIPEEGIQVRKGTPHSINLFENLSDNPTVSVKVTDFSGVKFEVKGDGADFVTIANGVITVKDSYSHDGIFVLNVAVSKGEATESFEFNLIIPVTGVTVSSESVIVKLNQYLQLSAEVTPLNASIKNARWEILDGKSADMLSDGRFRSKKTTGEFRIQSTVDGIKSNIITVLVVEDTVITENIAVKEVKVGDSITLKLNISPDTAKDYPVKWEIVSGAEFATLEGNTLTGVNVGSVTLRATVDGKTCEVIIAVLAADAKGLGGAAIAGIVAGAAVLVLGGGFCIYWFIIRKKNNKAVK